MPINLRLNGGFMGFRLCLDSQPHLPVSLVITGVTAHFCLSNSMEFVLSPVALRFDWVSACQKLGLVLVFRCVWWLKRVRRTSFASTPSGRVWKSGFYFSPFVAAWKSGLTPVFVPGLKGSFCPAVIWKSGFTLLLLRFCVALRSGTYLLISSLWDRWFELAHRYARLWPFARWIFVQAWGLVFYICPRRSIGKGLALLIRIRCARFERETCPFISLVGFSLKVGLTSCSYLVDLKS